MHLPPAWPRSIVLTCTVFVATSCAGAVAPGAPSDSSAASPSTAERPAVLWPAPTDPLERTVAAGLKPEQKEHLANHAHSHLDVFIDGVEVAVPAGIGINTEDPEVRQSTEADGTVSYGGIEMCDQPCISPLHTHDETGILHTESSDPQPHNLGQFFVEWGVELSETCVADLCEEPIAVYVDGAPYEGDPAAIELTDRKVIVIVIGTPPDEIPSTADFSNA
jgi:hypothetical protein